MDWSDNCVFFVLIILSGIIIALLFIFPFQGRPRRGESYQSLAHLFKPTIS